MKLEQLYLIFSYLLNSNFIFNINFISNLIKIFFLNYLFCWKITNYGDSYWFLYSNKKSIYELKHSSLKTSI